MMPHFDATITLGSILGALSIIVSGLACFVRFTEIQRQQMELLRELRSEFSAHEAKDDMRFERLENRIIDLVSGLQRLVGRMEVFRVSPRQE